MIDVVKERAVHFGFDVAVGPAAQACAEEVFGALFQYPTTTGEVKDLRALIAAVQAQKGLACVSADLLSLLLLKSPGELGPMWCWARPSALACPWATVARMPPSSPLAMLTSAPCRAASSVSPKMPAANRPAHGDADPRAAHPPRKANSNICTAQVLLANMASFYAVYHGPVGLKTIASRVHRLTTILALGLKARAWPSSMPAGSIP